MTQTCGTWMPNAHDYCARRPNHADNHRSPYALANDAARDRRRRMTKHDPHRGDLIVDAIRAFEAEYGHPPSVRDLMDEVQLQSTSAVHFHLRKLVNAGVLYGCRCGCGRYRVAA